MEFMKIMRYFSSVYDISNLKQPFHSISDVERSAYVSSTESNIETRKSQSFADCDENYALFLYRLRYFDV